MESKKLLRILGLIVFVISMMLLWSVNWKIAIGVLLFGWSLNVENYLKYKKDEK